MLSYTSLPSCFKQAITDQTERLAAEFLHNLEITSYAIDDRLTPQQLIKLHSVFAPLTFTCQPRAAIALPRDHLIPSVAMDIVDRYFENIADCRSLGIGTRFNKRNNFAHVCYKVDWRDEGRMKKHVFRNQDKRLGLVLNGKYDRQICTEGSEHCTFKAKVAFLNNVYDISPQTMCKIFKQHGLEIAYMAMMLPDEVRYNVSQGQNEHYRVYRKGSKHYMTFGSGAFDYGHDSRVWREWCNAPAVSHLGVNLTIERIGKFGPVTIMQITRVSKPVDVRVTFTGEDTYKKVYDYSAKSFWLGLHARLPLTSASRIRQYLEEYAPSFIVPSKLYDAIVKQGIVRPDENFTRQNLALHLKAETSRIVINSEVLQVGLTLTADQFSALLVSTYIDAAVHRQNETRTIGKIIGLLKGETFIERFNGIFKDVFKLVTLQSIAFPTSPGEALATGLKVRDLVIGCDRKLTGQQHSKFVGRDREDEWFAWTHDGRCVPETKAILRNGNRAFARLHTDVVDFTDEELLKVRIQNDHCQPLLNPEDYCDHDVSTSIYIPDSDALRARTTNLNEYHRYECAPHTDKRTTTKSKLDRFIKLAMPHSWFLKFAGHRTYTRFAKKSIAVLCASPGHDITADVAAANITNCGDCQVASQAGYNCNITYENVNIACQDCLNSVAENVLYCDLGMDAHDHKRLTSTQYIALLNLLSTGKRFCLKIQNFLKSCCLGDLRILMILDLVRQHGLYLYNVGNANEVFIHNTNATRPTLTDQYIRFDAMDGGRYRYSLLDNNRDGWLVTDFDNIDTELSNWECQLEPQTPSAPQVDSDDDDESDYQDPEPPSRSVSDSDDDASIIIEDELENCEQTQKQGEILPFSSDHISQLSVEGCFKASDCESVNIAVKVGTIDKNNVIIQTDCEKDEQLIQDTVAKGYTVIRRPFNMCDMCELSKVINYKTFVVNGDEIVTGSALRVQQPDFGKITVNCDSKEILIKTLQSEMRQPDARFDKINGEARKYLSTFKSWQLGELRCLVGCPGSGKTRFAMQAIPKDCTVITPYSRLSQEYKDAGFKAGTFVQKLTKRYKCVLLDEVFAFSPGMFMAWIHNADYVYMIGDPRQMAHVDEKRIYRNVKVCDMFDWRNCPALTVSYTLPIDVTRILNKHFDYNIKTMSRQLRSIEFKTLEQFYGDYNCFTTAHERNNSMARTVAKIQGSRCDVTQLLIEPNAIQLINEAQGQFVVAISRHRKKLVVCTMLSNVRHLLEAQIPDKHTCRPGGLKSYIFDEQEYQFRDVQFKEYPGKERLQVDDKFSRDNGVMTVPDIVNAIHNVSGQTLSDAQIDVECDVETAIDMHTPLLDYSHSSEEGTSFDHVAEILNKICPTLNQASDFYGVTTHDFEFDGIMQIKNLEAIANERERLVRRLPLPMYGRPTFINSASQSLHCIVSRYLKIKNGKKKLKEIHASKISKQFLDQILSKALSKIEKITTDDLNMAFAEFVDKIVTKHARVPLSNIDSDEQKLFASINGFLKQQNKADLNIEGWIRYENGVFKAGQGIAAQCKNVNVLAAAYIRAFEKKFKKCLKPSIHLVNGMSDHELASLVSRKFDPDLEHYGFDIKEFDTYHDKTTEGLMWGLYAAFGVPAQVYKVVGNLNTKWFLDYSIQDLEFPFRVKAAITDKMQSGRPDTLIKNSVVALAMILMAVEGEIAQVYVKGDDIYVQGRKLKLAGSHDNLKVDKFNPPAFVGYLMADRLTLDIPRLCVKLLNRNYPDIASVNDYIIAVKDWLKVIKGDEGKRHAAIVNANRYSITVDQAEYLLKFMYEFASGKIINKDSMNQLVKQYLKPFVVSNDETSY